MIFKKLALFGIFWHRPRTSFAVFYGILTNVCHTVNELLLKFKNYATKNDNFLFYFNLFKLDSIASMRMLRVERK